MTSSLSGETCAESVSNKRALRVNHPEAVALITDHVLEGARDGRTVVELMSSSREVPGRADVMDGIPQMLGPVQVEATRVSPR
ncbi:urease subunit gamma [Pseudonocardia sp.]|uniref:urease subunit gamma n=1 Tax=Pseudonocardia sp. TaxID=60912 RepID=UPI0031FD69E3